MTDITGKILEMSLCGSLVILLTVVLRFLLRKKTKRLMMILWVTVAVRLLIPINIESSLSMFNFLPDGASILNGEHDSAEYLSSGLPAEAKNMENEARAVPDTSESTAADTRTNTEPTGYSDGTAAKSDRITTNGGSIEGNNAIITIMGSTSAEAFSADSGEEGLSEKSAVLMENISEDAFATVNMPGKGMTADAFDIKQMLFWVWALGTAVIGTYCLVRYFMLKRKLSDALMTEKNVFVSSKVGSPFVFGFVRPAVYLPENLNDREKDYILLHEKTHIKHGDWLGKIIGMAAVTVHWFNPLVWLAYMLFEQDIEMSCDEKIIENMDEDMKRAYSLSIVSFAVKKQPKRYLITPLAFSRINFSKSEVKNRVKNILDYKKGSNALLTVMAVILIVVSTACSTNAKTKTDTVENIDVQSDNMSASEESEMEAATVKVSAGDDEKETAKLYVSDETTDTSFDPDRFMSDVTEILSKEGYNASEFTNIPESGCYSLDAYRKADDLTKEIVSARIDVCTSAEAASEAVRNTMEMYCDAALTEESLNGRSFSFYQKIDDCGTCVHITLCQKENYVIMMGGGLIAGPYFGDKEYTPDKSNVLAVLKRLYENGNIAYTLTERDSAKVFTDNLNGLQMEAGSFN